MNLRDNLTKTWEDMYEIAKEYYEEHKNLEVPAGYKTQDGINLGKWIDRQRQAYKGQGQRRITKEQIELLNKIGMIWFDERLKTDAKLQSEQIDEKNIQRKQTELQNRLYTFLGRYNGDQIVSKDEINEAFLEELNSRRKK